ncbi:unnamed protein product, partial [marine sediment metagenome]
MVIKRPFNARRSRLEIIIQTLQIIEEGEESPTRIMYST